jgi:hypothetical protein
VFRSCDKSAAEETVTEGVFGIRGHRAGIGERDKHDVFLSVKLFSLCGDVCFIIASILILGGGFGIFRPVFAFFPKKNGKKFGMRRHFRSP